MNDDYLWDRSGEPDPEIERLERVLGKYRYQPGPLSPALTSQFSWHRKPWVRLAAVAAAVLIAVGGLWVLIVQNTHVVQPQEQAKEERQPETPGLSQLEGTKKEPEPRQVSKIAAAPRGPRRIPRRMPEETATVSLPDYESDLIAERQLPMNPFVDFETARHIERAQLLLRSFRNTRDSDGRSAPDLAYEKQRSRGLLYRNVLLRRDAEAKGNMPVEELLGSLEPFLLDIANLPDEPSSDDVRTIKERMEKKEIVAALQIYSAPTLSQMF